ncbi:MAG: hypothetical protein A2268_09040 [Candidatus Raymondbacteria bacterium RifOxyA12_full_50_37]|uniref:Pyrrolo-quinoline quinone repeat domain-containing protein n=1 Tax=Candidatus Raymondbacteria bacterium RIFOXYD12_FULL_49_13 TaxID=1817890 RepID=A0A1F7F118_UNCRA|nr:MAG: hypothetical protein A2268_09040 [Candidatus Raymondbacteria bacterium RifOxyA12_full_50_37]OGJ86887.1 MAG: hypothetical protein A2248_08215 [Candidatus Raymondbacteria bacterium RIFOXYA2_FULL_49_16]OGJ94793.1 MAG: hypothetical protein A2350_20730 [Candidatus Raymondbacteria bacterium RifOxyB12_full_50_8]OGJ98042.1 MAG: hypothetical protein A2487_00895 [Candidatus Raymondbacteria bacterium RifOxyC12_full_50_8]OGK00237.1 MAG: hypothetical protein A2519_07125 [Candidatus Raymondbacteria b
MKLFLVSIAAAGIVAFGQNSNEWPVAFNTCHTSFSPTTVLKPPLKLRWMAKLMDTHKAGPVVAEGVVATQSRGGYVQCFDANTGQLLWRHLAHRVPDRYKGDSEISPAIWNGRVYAALHSGGNPDFTGMYCFDKQTGDVLWKKDVGYTLHRTWYSPQLSKGKLFFCSNREITGRKYPGPYEYKTQVQAWDALTGDTLWTYTLRDSGSCFGTTCLVVGDTLFASVAYAESLNTAGKTMAFDLNGTVLWTQNDYHVCAGVAHGNLSYIDNMLIFAADSVIFLDPANGALLRKKPYGGRAHLAFNMADRYYTRGYGAPPVGYDINSSEKVLTCTSPYRCSSGCAAPIVANGYVYLGFGMPAVGAEDTSGYLWSAFDESTGAAVWHFRGGSHNCPQAAIAYDRLYLLSGIEGLIYCFENE